MFNIDTIMQRLAMRRPIFHSEADFQHELAWEIHMALPEAAIRVERPPKNSRSTQHIDLAVEYDHEIVLIELKYIPRKWAEPLEIGGEHFNPKSGAGGRLGFIEDLARLETVVDKLTSEQKQVSGYAILLTSYPPYWKDVKKPIAAFADVFEGKILYGQIRSVEITGSYEARWRDYSRVSDGKYGQFRYLASRIEAEPDRRGSTEEREEDIITACAFRFDGYRYADDNGLFADSGWGKEYMGPVNAFLREPSARLERDHLHMLLFMMQRHYIKEGLLVWTSHEALAIRKLFLEVCQQDVPQEYAQSEPSLVWEKNFKPRLPELMHFIKHRDASTTYGIGPENESRR